MKIRHVLAATALLVSALGFASIATATDPPDPEGTTHTVRHGETAHAGSHEEHGSAEHGEHGGGEHASAHGGHHGPEAVNWTDISDKKRPAIIALLINFGLLAALYYSLAKKPVAEGLKQRRVTLGKDIEEAQKALAEAEERAKKYQADLKNADADAEAARSALVAAGKGDADRLVRDAEERAARMKRDAEKLVDQERRGVQVDLHNETVELALVEAQKVLETAVTADDHARLANDLLAELSRRPALGSRVSGGAS